MSAAGGRGQLVRSMSGSGPVRRWRSGRGAVSGRPAVVQQDRVDALTPAGVLFAQALEQLQPGARPGQVRRRDLRLGQPPVGESRSGRASARSVLARRFGPRAAAVSARSTTGASTPARCSSSTTNRRLVQPLDGERRRRARVGEHMLQPAAQQQQVGPERSSVPFSA
jgi:hypothetical protein